MHTDPASQIERLASLDSRTFDIAAAQFLAQAGQHGSVRVLYDSIVAICQSTGLRPRERDRRIQILSASLHLTGDQLPIVIGKIRESAPSALNAVRASLPPHLKVLAAPLSDVPAPKSEAVLQKPAPRNASALNRESEPPQVDLAQSGAFFGVVLVGSESEHVNNTALLMAGGLQVLRVATFEQLRNVSLSGLCGFAVAPSAWLGLDQEQQRVEILGVSQLSTFLFARIALDGLHPTVATEAPSIAVRARAGQLDGERFCHGSNCALTPADIQSMQAIAGLLRAAEAAGFYPLGLDEEDARLLKVIAADRRRPTDPVAVRKLATRELAGGRSGARVYLVQPLSGGAFVVKVHTTEALRDELTRHKMWIEDWEPNLTTPTLHLHQGRAAISYRLQASADAVTKPAPTLEDAFDVLRAAEWDAFLDSTVMAGMVSDLEKAVFRAADRLTSLNKLSGLGGTPSEFWLHWPLKGLCEKGAGFVLKDFRGSEVDLWKATEDAVSRMMSLNGMARVHGDIHGRNVLLVDRMPAFIDYAASGPGNPLEDLARLDAAVRISALRAHLSEVDLAKAFVALYVDGEGDGDVFGRFPVLASSHLSRLAIKCAVKIRLCAMEVAAFHGCGLDEYLDMVLIVSGHVIANRSMASVVERALLMALLSRGGTE